MLTPITAHHAVMIVMGLLRVFRIKYQGRSVSYQTEGASP